MRGAMEKLMLSHILFLAGIGMAMLGWLVFRRPGVAFWPFAAPICGSKYLKPPGAVLWFVGLVVAWGVVGLGFARLFADIFLG